MYGRFFSVNLTSV